MSIPDDWKEWIALNAALGNKPEGMLNIMVKAGFDAQEVAREIGIALAHPYIKGTSKIAMHLKKREWLLSLLNKKYATKNKYVLEPMPLPSFEVFLRDYYFENKPALFQGVADHWPARKWTPEMLKEIAGSSEVEVQSGRNNDPKYEENRDNFRRMMPFDAFVDDVLALKNSNDLYMTANNVDKSLPTLRKFFPYIGNIGHGYLNLKDMDNKCFVWLGPAGTKTPLHHDLTNNLFVQIYGRKRFLIAPACEAPNVYNDNVVYSNVDAFAPDYNKFPLYKSATVIELVVNPGDVLFIPIGWWHAVESLDISISTSFTNFNAPNHYNASYPPTMGDNY